MFPYLLDFHAGTHAIRIPTYGFLLALGFTAAYFDALKNCMKQDEDPRHIENIFLWVVLASVIGARMFHVLFEELPYYMNHPSKIFAVWEGGYTLYGAILASIVAIYLYTQAKGIKFLNFVDFATPATALGIGIGRVGCFLAGCCWGKPCNLPWAVTFTHPESFTSARNIPLHPVQLYEAFGAFLIYAYCTYRMNRRKHFGEVFFQGLILYSFLRFAVEFFRGDSYRGFVFGGAVSYGQMISLVLVPLAATGLFLYSRNQARSK